MLAESFETGVQDSEEIFSFDDLTIRLNIRGASEYSKVSFPIRYGRYHEIETPEYIFQVDLNGEVAFIQGRGSAWPHPAEWLKRSLANDWIYYSVGSYNDVHDLIGEYYFPCLEYERNFFFRDNPFDLKIVQSAFMEWQKVAHKIKFYSRGRYPEPLHSFLHLTACADEPFLMKKAETLRRLNGGLNTILPPDSRHVDYNLIPVVIAEGCLYHCGFCRFKTDRPFSNLNQAQLVERMKQIRCFLGNTLQNFNALFLGRHDALHAENMSGAVTFAAENAYDIFHFDRSFMKGAWLFFFGSVDSLLAAKESVFAALNNLPYLTFINIGFESGDPRTLEELKKPVRVSHVKEAFSKLMDINRRYPHVEITANFVLGTDLSENHYESVLDMARNGIAHFYNKGAVYFSPLDPAASKIKLLRRFNEFKRLNRLPTFIYLVQRL
ncbi:MAG: radical SAM protein [Thermodesulfobacteriota bacterium]